MADNQAGTEQHNYFQRIVGEKRCTRTQMRFPKKLVRAWGSDLPHVAILVDPAGRRWEVPIVSDGQKYAWLAESWQTVLDTYCIKDGFLVRFIHKQRAEFHFRSYVLYKEEIYYPYVDCPPGFQVRPISVKIEDVPRDVLPQSPLPLQNVRPIRSEPSPTAKEHDSDVPLQFLPPLQNLRPIRSEPSPTAKEDNSDAPLQFLLPSQNVGPIRSESSPTAKEHNSDVPLQFPPPSQNVRPIRFDAPPQFPPPLQNVRPIGLKPSPTAKEHNSDAPLQFLPPLQNVRPIRSEPSLTAKEHNSNAPSQLPLPLQNVRPIRIEPSPAIKEHNFDAPPQFLPPRQNVRSIRSEPSPSTKEHNSAFEAALSYKTNNPFFPITLTRYNRISGILHVPKGYALTMKPGRKRQRWVMRSDHAPECVVTCSRAKGSPALKSIGKGWGKFCVKANLAVGDALVVEVLDPDRRILYASIFRDRDYKLQNRSEI